MNIYSYILWTFSHGTELTQWDHPEMTEILHSLCELTLLNFAFTARLLMHWIIDFCTGFIIIIFIVQHYVDFLTYFLSSYLRSWISSVWCNLLL